MILELVGARVLAPYVGTSIVVWTSLLGVVMASLSLGYYLGGRVADRVADHRILSFIILLAGLSIGVVAVIKSPLLFYIESGITDIKWSSLVSAVMLFSPANVFLGAVSPYAIKIYSKDYEYLGTAVGSLYALSTVGSIVGTYFTGFFLISRLGSTNILFVLSVLLIFLSAAIYPTKIKIRCFLVILISAFPLINNIFAQKLNAKGFIDTDTQYNRVLIWDSVDPASLRPTRTLSTGAHYLQSAMFLDPALASKGGAGGSDLAIEYTKFFNLAGYFNPRIKKALMVGGGAYSFPKYFLLENKNASIDVVEIDPGLTRLAEKYFDLNRSPRLSVFHQDGRLFLNNSKNKYDAIFIDAFAPSIPFQLTTREFVGKLSESLNDGGVVAMNTISSINGDKGKFVRAEYKTYKENFDSVRLFLVQSPESGKIVQNIILIAVKNSKPGINNQVVDLKKEEQFKKYLSHEWTGALDGDVPVLTDNFAPVDQYLADIF